MKVKMFAVILVFLMLSLSCTGCSSVQESVAQEPAVQKPIAQEPVKQESSAQDTVVQLPVEKKPLKHGPLRIIVDLKPRWLAANESTLDDLKWWVDAGKLLFEGKYDKLDYETCDKMVDALLLRLAFAETMVRKRLKQLSGEE